MAHAQGFVSHLSVGAGFEGIFPASTFTKSTAETNTYPNTQTTTDSVGALADVRYDFGRHSAFDLALTVNRSTELFYYAYSQNVSRIQSNNGEMIGSYIIRLPSNEHLKALFSARRRPGSLLSEQQLLQHRHTLDGYQDRLRLRIWKRLQDQRSLGSAPAVPRPAPCRS